LKAGTRKDNVFEEIERLRAAVKAALGYWDRAVVRSLEKETYDPYEMVRLCDELYDQVISHFPLTLDSTAGDPDVGVNNRSQPSGFFPFILYQAGNGPLGGKAAFAGASF